MVGSSPRLLAFAPAAMTSEDAGKSRTTVQYQFDKEVVSASSDRVSEAQSLREQGGPAPKTS